MTTYVAYRDSESGEMFGESDIEDNYREMLNEVYGMVKIGPYEYETGRALESVDPVAFRVGLSDYSSEFEEIIFTDFDTYWEAIGK